MPENKAVTAGNLEPLVFSLRIRSFLQAINEKTVAACLYKLIFTKPQYSTKQTFLWGDMLTNSRFSSKTEPTNRGVF